MHIFLIYNNLINIHVYFVRYRYSYIAATSLVSCKVID